MKRTLFLTALMACCTAGVYGATYTDLTKSWCDEENNVIYDGQGYFAVASAANTSVGLTINLASLVSYVNSNDYAGSSYMLLWENSIQNYGLGDNADTATATPNRVPTISGYTSSAWNAGSNYISYDTLSKYADKTTGCVTLNITNSTSDGVTVTATDADGTTGTLYTAGALRYGSMSAVTGYYVNLNYVTAVTLNTKSTLDTAPYVQPVDYSQAFVSARTGTTSLSSDSIGRVTFLGDSITHGVNDQSYRWQFFKILTDNGIENQLAGPRSGYFNTPGHTEDAGSSYGGAKFANVHLAQASGRTHNIISGSTNVTIDGTTYTSGVNYGGHSTASTAEDYDSNTWICMMGTNDMLSDSGSTTTDYCNKMAKMLGGTVSYSAEAGYTWTADSTDWGTMGTIVSDVHGEGDTFYMLSITPWTTHGNSNAESFHFGAQEFNRNLEAWTEAYSTATGKNVVYVDVTRGMVDKTSEVSFYSPGEFFNNPGSDGLHPNDQGSLIMAGNLARAMGIGGRTAGLARQGTSGWNSTSVGANGTIVTGRSYLVAENAFTMSEGYTVDLSAEYGDGATGGWLDSTNALSISLGDGTNSGTLNLSEGYIMWGSEVLFCADTSTLSTEGNLRIAWHNGNEGDNVLSGYYVWLGDMLIGQGLDATTGEGLNGIVITATGANGSISNLTWTDTAYAPTTEFTTSTEYAYTTTQDAASVTGTVQNTVTIMPEAERTNTAAESGISYSGITGTKATEGQILVGTATDTGTTIVLSSGAGWTGMTNTATTGDINVQVTGTTTYTVFGAMNNAKAGTLTLEVVAGASVGDGLYDGQTGAIAGSYGGGSAKAFRVYIHGGEVNGDIVGGAIHGSGSIGEANIVINDGLVKNIIGGSKTAGTVGKASIVVNGGTVNGSINAGGNAGTVGDTDVTINGGVILGDITKGTATRTEGAKATVTVEGTKAYIGGDITADEVTFRNVKDSGYSDGFDRYSGTVTADKLTLDNVSTDVLATLTVKAIEVINSSQTSVVLGDTANLATLTLDSDTVFSAYKAADARNNETAHETTITVGTLTAGTGATLNANLVFTAGSTLALSGTLTMGSDVALQSGMALELSDALLEALYGGTAIDIFTGVDALTLDGEQITDGYSGNADGVFSGLSQDYTYTMAFNNGVVSLSAGMVPEPTTATLSLLALAALAARRRRR
ncbi:MAG: hypothetical protein IJA63_11445 [Akkermansia sp.]|nr:hypothetical protein [Akkermansia sp.]MBQ3526876.1 hypothetical protein [Akkermansia sp.]